MFSWFLEEMKTTRIEAFSDGVIAILITIMVLELKPAHGEEITTLHPQWPIFISYILSFLYLGIYWNNHHHLFAAVEEVSASMMWGNLHLLFWLSIIPFTTAWMGENGFAPVPVALYGAVMFLSAIAFWILQSVIIRSQGKDSKLKAALGNDFKGKASPIFYLIAIGMSFVNAWIAGAIYFAVALMWIVPDRRIEKVVEEEEKSSSVDR